MNDLQGLVGVSGSVVFALLMLGFGWGLALGIPFGLWLAKPVKLKDKESGEE